AHDLLPLLGGNGANLAAWRTHQGTLYHRRRALLIEERNQPLPHTEFHDHLFHVELRICAESLSRRFDRLLVFRSKGAHGMLPPIAELAQDPIRDIDWILGDEED